jgi:hypothetical protein
MRAITVVPDRPGSVPCRCCAVGEWDMCRNGRYTERGIKELPAFGAERWRIEPEFAVPVAPALGALGVLLEPASIVAKAWEHVDRILARACSDARVALVTGAGPIGLLAALLAVQRGLETHVLDVVTEGPKPRLVRDLGATYHANRRHDELGAQALARADSAWLGRLVTRRVPLGRWPRPSRPGRRHQGGRRAVSGVRRRWGAHRRRDGGRHRWCRPPCATSMRPMPMPLDLDGVAPDAPDAVSPFAPRPDVVAVFDRDPDLAHGVDLATADHLRRRAWAPRLVLEPGAWLPGPELAEEPGHLGLLVVDGLLTRTAELDGRQCPELVGTGDLLRPWDGEGVGSIELATHWRVLQPTTLAVLDARFAAAACRFPPVVAALLGRAVQRSRALSLHLAIAHVRQAEPRLLVLLWHLADRWGRVTPSGVHVPVALTHELLAHLACLRRPTASSALMRLARAGEVVRRRDGTWLLTGDPPATGGRLARLRAAA